jgi:hypothetical protein
MYKIIIYLFLLIFECVGVVIGVHLTVKYFNDENIFVGLSLGLLTTITFAGVYYALTDRKSPLSPYNRD